MCRKADHYGSQQSSVEDGRGIGSKKRRSRTAFTEWQLACLERRFSEQQYMVGEERTELAQSLQLNPSQVKIWFQNRRIRWRREHFERLRQVHTFAGANPTINIISATASTSPNKNTIENWNSNSTPNIKQQLQPEPEVDKKL